MRSSPNGESGFGLLEAIIALAIVTVSIGALTRVQATALRTAGRVGLQQAALRDARAHLDTLTSQGTVKSGTYSGAYADGLGWRLTVSGLVDTSTDGNANGLIPYWLVLRVADRSSRTLVQLETAKLGRDGQ